MEAAERAGPQGLAFIARGEARATRIARAAQALAPAAMVVRQLPGWDCLPFDRVSPSRAVMGARMSAALALAEAGGAPRLLVLSVEAALQRLPRPEPAAWLRLERGGSFDPDALRRDLSRLGYLFDERVDEPGEATIHGGVADLFPADAPDGAAWRLRHEDGRILEITRLDVVTQRSLDARIEAVELGPASEIVFAMEEAERERPPGPEHALPAMAGELVAPLDLLPRAPVVLDADAEERIGQRPAEVREAHAARRAMAAQPGLPPLPPPEALYLDATSLEGRSVIRVRDVEEAGAALPSFAQDADPEAAFIAYAAARRAEGVRIALAGGIGRGARRLLHRLSEAVGAAPQSVDGWPGLLHAPPGTIALLGRAPDHEGFATPEAVVVPLSAVRPQATPAGANGAADALVAAGAALQPGDAVIHLDHGLAALRGIEAVEAGGASLDCARLDFADASRLVPFDEFDRLWRYG
ncbi:MAG TPA: CarD family transcriptional regulator, partial [Acetobacteraceae bacterium]|nr:CarD family transcriptional regulator [Acetobacteraceae bacterium]